MFPLLAGAQEKKADEPPEGPRPIETIKKEMQLALASGDYPQVGRLVGEAAELKTVAAYQAIIALACRGDDRDLEFTAFQALCGADPAALDLIASEAVKNPNFKTRIILQGVCFQLREDPRAFAALVAGLKDPSKSVVLTAIRWLRDSQNPERAVPPLIEVLVQNERMRQGRIANDVNNALRALTKAELSHSIDWRNYWESHKGLAGAKTKPKPPGKTGVTQVKTVKFFNIPIESDRILFIIDTSGSMEKRDPIPPEPKTKDSPPVPNGKTAVPKREKTETKKGAAGGKEGEEEEELPLERQRIHRVKEELIRTIRALPENIFFTIEYFDNEIGFLNDPPALIAATPDNKRKAESWVKALRAKGETWTDTAFEKSLGKVKDVDTVILLSDGMPYRNGKQIEQSKVRREIKIHNRFIKARVNTIGFRQAGDNLRQFLYDLAHDHDGIYVELR